MKAHANVTDASLEEIIAADTWARVVASERIAG